MIYDGFFDSLGLRCHCSNLGVLMVLNHKADDVFEWEGEDDGTPFLWILFIAVCWPFAVPVVCAIFAATWLFRGHGEDSDD